MSMDSQGIAVAGAALIAAAKTFGLFVGDPASTGVEASGGSYSRATAASWSLRGGAIGNTRPIIFSKPIASWGALTHFRVFDISGNALWSGQLTRTVTLDATTPALVLGAGTALARIA